MYEIKEFYTEDGPDLKKVLKSCIQYYYSQYKMKKGKKNAY